MEGAGEAAGERAPGRAAAPPPGLGARTRRGGRAGPSDRTAPRPPPAVQQGAAARRPRLSLAAGRVGARRQAKQPARGHRDQPQGVSAKRRIAGSGTVGPPLFQGRGAFLNNSSLRGVQAARHARVTRAAELGAVPQLPSRVCLQVMGGGGSASPLGLSFPICKMGKLSAPHMSFPADELKQ